MTQFSPSHSDKDSFYLTTWQSAVNEFGSFAGVLLSGYLVSNFGIREIVLIDAASFFLFGLFILYYFGKGITPNHGHEEEFNEKGTISPQLICISIVIATVAIYFQAWDHAPSTSIAEKLLDFELDQATYFKAAVGGIGLLAGVFLSKYFRRKIFSIWIASILIASISSLFIFP